MNHPPVQRDRQHHLGFTLIELLVAITVIAVLVALILPAVQSARESARRLQCQSHLKQLALAVHNFHDTERAVPAMDLGIGWATWAVLLLPQLEQSNLYEAWDLKKQYGAQGLDAGKDLAVFHCPSQTRAGLNKSRGDGVFIPPTFIFGPPGWSDFAGVAGTSTKFNDGAFRRAIDVTTGKAIKIPAFPSVNTTINPWRYPMKFADFSSDGLSNTLLFGEKYLANPLADTSVFNGVRQPGYVRVCSIDLKIVDPGQKPILLSDWRFGSQHTGICNFAFADGHVVPMSTSSDAQVVEYLAKVADGAITRGF